jgi:2'-5' RNA ligase
VQVQLSLFLTRGGQWDSYLTMNLPYEPVSALYKQLEKQLGLKLISRGEAHITIITPPEYFDVLRSKISIDEINQIARQMNVQKSKFEVLGVGRGEALIENTREQTYFIVVRSPELVNIRKKIFETFVKNGGDPHRFDPMNYNPHVTIGFTKRDLHESDGFIKGIGSLFSDLKVT